MATLVVEPPRNFPGLVKDQGVICTESCVRSSSPPPRPNVILSFFPLFFLERSMVSGLSFSLLSSTANSKKVAVNPPTPGNGENFLLPQPGSIPIPPFAGFRPPGRRLQRSRGPSVVFFPESDPQAIPYGCFGRRSYTPSALFPGVSSFEAYPISPPRSFPGPARVS